MPAKKRTETKPPTSPKTEVTPSAPPAGHIDTDQAPPKKVAARKVAPRGTKASEPTAGAAVPAPKSPPVKAPAVKAPSAKAATRKAPAKKSTLSPPGPAEPARVPSGEPPLRVLMVAPEAHPFAKTGGLAEVAGALPAALTRLGHHVTLVLPRYRGVDTDGWHARPFHVQLGERGIGGRLLDRALPDGVHSVLVDVPELFDRPGLYGADGQDYPDNAFRYAVLSRAALEYARLSVERYSVIHAHDWQTGLVPVFQKMVFSNDPAVGGVPCVFTIHNLAFQGVFPSHVLPSLGLGWNVFNPDALEYWGNISFLKAGVNFSERITTVSPTYAREIVTPEFGFGFEGVLARRASDLIGIVNGIDVQRWNPEADDYVGAGYSAEKLEGKRAAKRRLLEQVGLPSADEDLQRPVIGLISRLTDQKGFDLIGAALEELLTLDATWVMLGSGERHYEEMWRTIAGRHPARVSATIGFDERLAHLIEAGADMFLMPSRFEPCGLNQLYSLRYGTVPIVRATGGLEDTVTDAQQPGGNGIKFVHYTRDGLLWAVRRALDLYKDQTRWAELQRNGMRVDASWDVSAREYVKVYKGLVEAAAGSGAGTGSRTKDNGI
jgi:starch synthase